MDDNSIECTQPLVSVMMNCYNGEKFLTDAVESILNQSYSDFEFIIINDGSTDSSSKILNKYAAHDPRIVLIEQENKGLITALNLGLKIAKAPLIARMDADDIAHKDRFKIQKSFMDTHPEIAVVGTNITLIDENNKTIRDSIYPRQGKPMDAFIYEMGSPVAHPSVMMRKDIVLSIGGYREAYKHAEDYDLWLRIHKIAKLDNIETPLLFYRQHADKISFKNAYQQSLSAIIARYAAQEEHDPTEDLIEITIDTIALFPKEKRAQINLEIMEALLNSTALKGDEKIAKKVMDNINLYKNHACNKTIMRLYLKTAFTYKNQKHYKRAILCLIEALRLSPYNLIAYTISKIMKRCKQNVRIIARKSPIN